MADPIPGAGNPLFYALRYAALGWHVFPAWWAEEGRCGCRNAECKSPGKHPHVQVRRGQQEATTDGDTIKRWWSTEPRCNVAIFLLPSNLVAIDIDPRNGGFETIADIEAQYGPLQSDVLQLTGGDGEHRLFYAPLELLNTLPGKLGPGIDVKVNGYIIAEPSIHISGKRYAWEASSDPLHGAVPSPLPDWLRNMAAPAPAPIAQSATRSVTDEQLREIRSALAFLASDDYHQWVNVGQALKPLGQIGFGLWDNWSQLSDKYEPKGMPEKWRSFRSGTFQIESVFHLAQQAGWLNPMSVEAKKEAELIELAKQAQRGMATYAPVEADDRLRRLPVDQLEAAAQWVESCAGVKPNMATRQMILGIASLACSRLYQTEFGDPGHLYLGIITPSIGDVSYVHDYASRILDECGLRRLVRDQRISSPTAFYKTLMRAPATLYLAHDYGTMVAFARRQPSGVIEQVLHLISTSFDRKLFLIDNPEEVGLRRPGANEDMPTIRRPALSMLGLVSEEQLGSVFKLSEYGRGALEKVLFARVQPVERIDKSHDQVVPLWLKERILTLRKLPEGMAATDRALEEIFSGNAELEPDLITVRFSQDLDQAHAEIDAVATHRRARALATAAKALMRRVALALAVWRSPIEPVITADLIEWSTAYVIDRLNDAMNAFNVLGTEDGRQSAYQQVLEVVTNEGGVAGLAKSDLPKYCWRFRSLGADARADLITMMVSDKVIVSAPGKSGKGIRYIAAHLVSEVESERPRENPEGQSLHTESSSTKGFT